MSDAANIAKALNARQLTKSAQVLLGIVTGMVSDGDLNDAKITFLNAWMNDNHEVTQSWPGSVIAGRLREALSDRIITTDERKHLVDTLQGIVGNQFSDTGSVSTEVASLPYDECSGLTLAGKSLCMTGEFMYGTRADCERVSVKAGAIPLDGVTKNLHYLVIGTRVSPHWVNTSYGRKIQKVLELREFGTYVQIIPERVWFESIGLMGTKGAEGNAA